MSLFVAIKQRIRRDFFRWRYQNAVQHVLRTPPLRQGTLPFTLLSMVHKRDVRSYLVAAKSFSRFANPSHVVVVCDPSIDDDDRAVLKEHIPHIELRAADEFTDKNIPRGGTWERLFAISAYAAESYVIQLDADTATIAPIPEVLDAIHNQTGFVLGEVSEQRLVTLEEASANARPKVRLGAHIQTLSEDYLAEAGFAPQSLYVRGCSGFTGFPRSIAMREQMLHFSGVMMKHFGTDWSRWGTEQVTSNYIVANAHGTRVLPFPQYGTPDVTADGIAFLHFIGSMRFVNGKYQRTSSEIIRSLGARVA